MRDFCFPLVESIEFVLKGNVCQLPKRLRLAWLLLKLSRAETFGVDYLDRLARYATRIYAVRHIPQLTGGRDD